MVGTVALSVWRRIDWRLFLIAAWGLILLCPLRETGWLGDDLFNSSLPGQWIYRNISPFGAAASDVATWTTIAGRLTPGIQIWKDLAFWLFPNLYWYKWAQIAAALAALLVFYGCLRGMKAEANLAVLASLLASGLIQFRALADPVLAFDGVLPLLMTITSLSVLLLYRHRITGSRLALVSSFLLYLAAALTYEMAYVFWVLHLWVLLRTGAGWKRFALTLLPFVSAPLLLGAGSLCLRMLPTFSSASYMVRFDSAMTVDLFLKQFTAALPCSYSGLDANAPVSGLLTWATFRRYAVLSGVAFLLYGCMVYRLIRRAQQDRLALGWWALLGLLIAVAPVLVLCACSKYQGAFHYGFGYLPVYIQYFGVALLLAAGVAALGGRLRYCPTYLLAAPPALLFAAFTVLHYAANVQVVTAHRVPYLFPRCEVEEVVDAGLLREVSPGGILVIDRIFPWELFGGDVNFYCQHAQTRLGDVLALATDAEALENLVPAKAGDDGKNDLTRLRYINVGQPGGFAVAGRLRYARIGPDGRLTESGVDRMRLAVWRGAAGDPLRDRAFVFHTCCWHLGGDPQRVDPVDLHSPTLRRVRTTEHWSIYEIDTPYPYLDSEAAWIEFTASAPTGRPPL